MGAAYRIEEVTTFTMILLLCCFVYRGAASIRDLFESFRYCYQRYVVRKAHNSIFFG